MKRRYQRSNQRFTFTATQVRQIERSEELEKRAAKIRERENRRVANKRKREDKEAKEREQRVKAGLPPEPKIKVTASQPRLSQFFGGRQPVPGADVTDEDDCSTGDDSELYASECDGGSDTMIVREEDIPAQIELEDCFSSSPAPLAAPPTQERETNGRAPAEVDAQALRRATHDFYNQLAKLTPKKDAAQIVAEVQSSQSHWDFEIVSDEDIEKELQGEDRLTAKNFREEESRKRKASGDPGEGEPDTKNARQVLSIMSESKVNTRTQETTPTAKPLNDWSPPQNAEEILAMIQTQDLDSEKENLEPRAPSPQTREGWDNGRRLEASPLQKHASADDDLGDLLDLDDDPFADDLDADEAGSLSKAKPIESTRLLNTRKACAFSLVPVTHDHSPLAHSKSGMPPPSSSYGVSLTEEEILRLADVASPQRRASAPKTKGRTLPWVEGATCAPNSTPPEFDCSQLDEATLLALEM